MAKKESTTVEFTPRSQANILRQEELEKKRAYLQRVIGSVKEEIAELEKRRDSVAKAKLEGEGWAWRALEAFIAELRVKGDLLEVHESQLREIEAQIAACAPTAEEAAARQENQKALAGMAEERLPLDADMDAALDNLRSLLEQRGQLTSQIAERAGALEMELDLDQERFDALAASLPAKMERRSRAWAERLLGRPSKPMRAIARGRVVVPESLALAGIFDLGDELVLNEEEFAELSRTNRPAPGLKVPWSENYIGTPAWRCYPRGIWTPEEYEAAQRKAKAEGTTLRAIVIAEDQKADEENKARLIALNERFVKVRVVRGAVQVNGRLITAGSTGEIPLGLAKTLAQTGQVEIMSAL